MSSPTTIQQADLTAGQKLVWYALKEVAGPDRWYRGTVSGLADYMGASRSHVSRALSALREADWAESDASGNWRCSSPGVTEESRNRDQTITGGVTDQSQGGTDESHSVTDEHDSVTEQSHPESDSDSPSRQKKVSTPSKKNSPSPSEPSSSLRSEDCSGDGSPDQADGDTPKVSAGGLPDDDTSHPAIGIYRRNAERHPNREDRRRIIDAVGEKGTEKFARRMTPWRKTMNDWAKNSWSWGNIDGMLDRFSRKIHRQNGDSRHHDTDTDEADEEDEWFLTENPDIGQ